MTGFSRPIQSCWAFKETAWHLPLTGLSICCDSGCALWRAAQQRAAGRCWAASCASRGSSAGGPRTRSYTSLHWVRGALDVRVLDVLGERELEGARQAHWRQRHLCTCRWWHPRRQHAVRAAIARSPESDMKPITLRIGVGAWRHKNADSVVSHPRFEFT